jgi:hypothetical protein
MSTQVVRVQTFTKGSLSNIGKEVDRDDIEHRNADIDVSLSHLNRSYKDAPNGFYNQYGDIKTALNAQGKEVKNGVAFEGMVITANKEFFEKLGWQKGQSEPKEVKEFFDRSYSFALEKIGYQGTDKNILSAKVHYDETTPHLQLYYLPITEKWQDKVYAKDENGKVLRSEKGTPIQAKDENGKTIYNECSDCTAPKLSRAEFWRVRGGQHSYRIMQDQYQESVGKHYGLERGDIGSDREHRSKNQWEAEQLRNEVEPLKKLKTEIQQVDDIGKTMPFGQTLIKTVELEKLKKQANSYTANRDEIETVRERTQAVSERESRTDLREESLNEKENVLEEKEQSLNQMFEKQSDLNSINQSLEVDNDFLRLKVKDLTETVDKQDVEISSLRSEIRELTNQIRLKVQEATQALKNTVESLTARLDDACEYVRGMAQAIGFLKYDKEDYKAELTPKQERLLDAVTNYASSRLRGLEREDLATEVDEHIKISKGMQHEIEKLEPKHQISHSFDGPSL